MGKTVGKLLEKCGETGEKKGKLVTIAFFRALGNEKRLLGISLKQKD